MEKIDILLWIVGVGFTFNFALMLLIWQSISKLNEKASENSILNFRLDLLHRCFSDIDRRLCRMEVAFSMKECCRISPDELKKVG